MKVLFLDIDGVLNCMYPTPSQDRDWVDLDEWRYGFNPDLVARLRHVLFKTGCKIVVSSSWRHHTSYAPYQPQRNWRDVLAEMLHKTRDEVFVGETPMDNSGKRGLEIMEWLSMHEDVTDYCVVDDETVDIEPYIDKGRIVKTDMKIGLTGENACCIIDVLDKGEQK